MPLFLRQTRILQSQVEEFLDTVDETGQTFREGIRDYLAGEQASFRGRLEAVGDLESRADHLRRAIEETLYTHTLIPEQRGDVLGLLENTDDVINAAKKALTQVAIERPEIPADLADEFRTLTDLVVRAAAAVVRASRAFFTDPGAVKEPLEQVMSFEKRADAVEEALTRRLFAMELDLGRKMHLRYFVQRIASIADLAEDVGDRLAIYAIKRAL